MLVWNEREPTVHEYIFVKFIIVQKFSIVQAEHVTIIVMTNDKCCNN